MKREAMQRLTVIAQRSVVPLEPQVARFQLPLAGRCVTLLGRQGADTRAIELADAAVCVEVEIPGFILQDLTNVVVAQPVLGRVAKDVAAVISIHTIAVASEPVPTLLVLVNDPKALIQILDDIAQLAWLRGRDGRCRIGNPAGRRLVLRSGVGTVVPRGCTGGESGDEARRDDRG